MTTILNTPFMEERIARKEAVNAAALLRMELEEAATDRDRYKRERDLALREVEAVEAKATRLREAGAQLANIAFNLRQRPETKPAHAEAMKQAQEAWDAAALETVG